ncbi:MAG: hypothetical protein JW862_15320 [Anaerolineales bacterium]|nr:hypothetical protein [Anaerolineales bacterium]
MSSVQKPAASSMSMRVVFLTTAKIDATPAQAARTSLSASTSLASKLVPAARLAAMAANTSTALPHEWVIALGMNGTLNIIDPATDLVYGPFLY